MKSVGIDIGSSSIKVVEVSAGNKGLHISRFFEQPIGTNPGYDPAIEVIEYLRSLAQSYDPQNTRFVFGLRQDQVSVRNKIFPFSDRQKILKSLPFELEEDLPLSSDTAVFDAKVIRTMGSTAEVLACATPKRRVAEAIQLLEDAGLDVSIISAEGVALSNCFQNWDAPPPSLPPQEIEVTQTTLPDRHIRAIVHIGHTRTIVLALEDGLLIGVRSLLWGAKNIAEAISRRYELPYIEALKEMQAKAFVLPSKEGASYDQIVFSDTIGNQLRELGKDLKIALLEFKAEFSGVVDSVGLTGGGSQILNIQTLLTMLLEVPVNKLQTLADVSTSVEKTPHTDASIGVALGLAIEGLKKPRNPALNFLRGEFGKQNQTLKILWDKWGTAIKVAGAALVVFFIYASFRDDFAINLADQASEALKTQARSVARLPAKQANRSGVQKYIRTQKTRANEMKKVASLLQMNSAMEIIKKVSDAVPAKNAIKLNVKSISVIDSTVRIQGDVASAQELTLLQSTLKSLAMDGRVTALPANLGQVSSGRNFNLEFKVDRGVTK